MKGRGGKDPREMMNERFAPIASFYPNGGAPVVKCPNYGLCGDYALMARKGSRPGKLQVLCAYCARRLEEREAAALPIGGASC